MNDFKNNSKISKDELEKKLETFEEIFGMIAEQVDDDFQKTQFTILKENRGINLKYIGLVHRVANLKKSKFSEQIVKEFYDFMKELDEKLDKFTSEIDCNE